MSSKQRKIKERSQLEEAFESAESADDMLEAFKARHLEMSSQLDILVRSKRNDPFWFQRFIPSASWIVKSWEASEEELFAVGGLDAVVFLRAVVFRFRITVKKFGFLHDIEMNISALLTSSGINTAVCAVLFSFYSILRKQPSLVSVYFGQKLAQVRSKRNDPFWFQRFIPSASWIVKSWEASEEELFAIGGLDAVVFLRAVVFW
ncbi:CSC1-like protein RXW8 [Abeliophyllum distichum]|uniref:CSC1-like protein RXW8 n=1 Tax=Abeliophyllum distichum TaxID=126358 RepID=A0ABD1UFU3_9LAMI